MKKGEISSTCQASQDMIIREKKKCVNVEQWLTQGDKKKVKERGNPRV